MMASRLRLLLAILLLINISYGGELSPFVVWSNRDSFLSAESPGDNLIDITASLMSNVKDELVVVFTVNELTFDDFNKYYGVYGSHSSPNPLHSAIGNAKSTYWTGLKISDNEWISTLALKLERTIKYYNEYTTDLGTLTKDNIVVVNMNELERQHFIFEQIMKEINKKSYVAIYTSYVSQSSQRNRREVNELPFVEDMTPYNVPPNSEGGACNIQGAFNVSSPTPCLLFCVNEINVKVNPEDSNTTTFDCTVSYPSSVSFCCVNTTSENEACAREEFTTVSLNYTIDGRKNRCSNGSEEVPGYIFIKFLFPFIVSGNKSESTANFKTSPWNVTMEITYSDSNETCPLNRRTEAGCLFEEFAVPNGLSYACSANEHSIYSSQIIQNDCLKRGNNNQTVSVFSCAYNVTATLSGLQVQPYSVSSSTFSSAYQCVGYFTPVIWMGVFSAAILLLILYCSLLCIFSMQTIDKFEDPRGQSISVEKLH